MGTLAKFAEIKDARRADILDFLFPLVDDCEFMMRMRLPGAFERIGDDRAIAPLRRLEERELDGRIQRRARDAVSAIIEGRSRLEEGERMRAEMEKLREDNIKLKERLDKLEAATAAKPPCPSRFEKAFAQTQISLVRGMTNPEGKTPVSGKRRNSRYDTQHYLALAEH